MLLMDQPAQTADVTEEFLTELRTINKHLARICRATEDALGAQQSARSTPRSPLEQFQAEADSQALRWRVAPDVRDLAVELRDAGGDVIWSDSLEVPPPLVSGTGLDAGDARFVARGTGRDGPFRIDRPFHVGPPDELLPGPAGPPLDIVASRIRESDRRPGPGLPPAWPFAASALLLCAEWIWRRRVGLR